MRENTWPTCLPFYPSECKEKNKKREGTAPYFDYRQRTPLIWVLNRAEDVLRESTIRQKGEGIALGILVLYALNLVRTVSLFLVGTYFPGLFDTAHYIVWQSLMILLAIGLWLFWVEKLVYVTPR